MTELLNPNDLSARSRGQRSGAMDEILPLAPSVTVAIPLTENLLGQNPTVQRTSDGSRSEILASDLRLVVEKAHSCPLSSLVWQDLRSRFVTSARRPRYLYMGEESWLFDLQYGGKIYLIGLAFDKQTNFDGSAFTLTHGNSLMRFYFFIDIMGSSLCSYWHGYWADHRLLGSTALRSFSDRQDDIKFDIFRRWLRRSIAKERYAGEVGDRKPNVQISHFEICPPELLPSRLLEIRGENVHLLCTSAGDMDRYATLTHRWGRLHHFTTNTTNFLQNRDGISRLRLPRTYQDALTVCERLGVRFIWIDAVCIIQDDAQDWITQSARMGDVYQNALFNIAAHAAADDADGFLLSALGCPPEHSLELSDGKSDKYNSLCSNGTLWEALLNTALPSNHSQRFYTYPEGCFDSDVDQSHLSSRGWVMQERMLSKRILHFTPGRVYWEDDDFISPDYDPSCEINVVDSRRWRSTLLRPERWLDLIERYSQCQLTVAGDKLVAILALAKRIHERIGGQYCAGLWSNSLHAGLLWFAKDQMLERPPINRAPTWSWASVDGPVQFPPLHERLVPAMDILGVQLIGSASSEQQAALINGPARLTVRTHIKKVRTMGMVQRQKPVWWLLVDTGWDLIRARANVRTIIDDEDRTLRVSIGWVCLDREDGSESFSSELYCAKVAFYPPLGQDYSWRYDFGLLVLILERCSTPANEFVRVGVGNVVITDWFRDAELQEISIV